MQIPHSMTVNLNLNRSSSVPLPQRAHTSRARSSHKKKKGFLSRVFGRSLDEEAMQNAFDEDLSQKEDERGSSFGSDSTTGSLSGSSLERLNNKGFMSSPRRGMLSETTFETLESFHRKLRACKTQASYCSKLSRSQSLFTVHVRISVRACEVREYDPISFFEDCF